MKLESFKEFKEVKIKKLNESKSEIDSICQEYGIYDYTINDDLSIDVDGNVDLLNRKLKKLPLKFRYVSGYFDCHNNNLTSLEGSPQSVGSYFYCSSNQLTTLEGSPQTVDNSFYCRSNKLISLIGGPKKVGGYFDCADNQLKDIKGFPERFYGRILNVIDNPIEEIFGLFPIEMWIELPEVLNEYDVPRDGKLIILQRLEQCFYDLGLEVPEGFENKKFKNYEVREF